MNAKRKKYSGDGWTFVPAGGDEPTRSVVHSLPAAEQRPRIVLEKRKKGKVVTVISDLVLTDPDLKDLAKQLKNSCGTGGTVSEGTIELQGDHRDAVRQGLTERGFGA